MFEQLEIKRKVLNDVALENIEAGNVPFANYSICKEWDKPCPPNWEEITGYSLFSNQSEVIKVK